MTALAPVLQGYFTDRLAQHRPSPHTVASYRDTWRLLLVFASKRCAKKPSALDLGDLDAELIGAFLDHLEAVRGNSITTRNLRLVAIHGLYSYAALRCPEHAALIARVLAIPTKRTDTSIVTFLNHAETDALLAAVDVTTTAGRRDHLLLLVAVQTGLRVSELTGLTCCDVTFGTGAHLRCTGKGRKERTTPLTRATAKALAAWIRHRNATPTDPLFPTRAGGRLSTDAVADLLAKHLAVATVTCPSLATKNVTPHTLRHTCAMNMLHKNIDVATIALWLGHSGIKATNAYLHADLTTKEQALARAAPPGTPRGRYRPPDSLLAFLEDL